MQRIFNYGSSLQGYALMRLLEQTSGEASVSFIDYTPGGSLIRDTSAGGPRGVSRVISKMREYGAIDATLADKVRFFNHKRRYGARYHAMVGIPQGRLLDSDVDLQVIGSDEVFNCVQSNVNVGFSPDLFGLTSNARLLVSYAGSFGNTTLRKMEEAGVRDEVARGLSAFAAISVRDENSANIVKDLLGGEAPPVHFDPTLVYDLMKMEPNIPTERPLQERYVIVYGYSGRFREAENRAIREYADKHRMRVLAFGGLQESADEFVDCNPFELLAYFRHAEAVVTDTFHGTIFSVINEVPFVSIIRRSEHGGYGNEEKLGYLLGRLGLDGRSLENPSDLERLLEEPIDFASVGAIRDAEAVRSREYLAGVCRQAGLGSVAR